MRFLQALFLCFVLSLCLNADENSSTNLQHTSRFILENNGILNQKVATEIENIGTELYQKTGIFLALAISQSKSLEELLALQENFKEPFAMLVLSINSHKVDIVSSKEVASFFDKNAVLSPYAGEGSILPILTSPKGKDIYNAAMLNGYADIADKIASYFHIKLENSIGNANKDTLNILRIIFYGFICFALLFYFSRKVRKKRNV